MPDEFDDDELIIDEDDEHTEGEEPDYKAEALKYKSMAKRYKARAIEAAKPKPETTITREETEKPVSTMTDEIVDLRLDGHSKEQVDFIMRNGGRKALEDPYVKAAITSMKEQAEAEANASKLEDNSGMTEVERKFSPEQLKEMSRAELEKILPKA